jgi:DNA polymerase type B, organellar and viral
VSNYDASRIEKPRFFRLAPLLQGRGSRPPHVVGFDTEASEGQPILMQFSEGGGPADADLIEVPDRRNAGLDVFMRWVSEHCTSRRHEHVVVGFNLMYEWTQLFGDLPTEIIGAKEFLLTWESTEGKRWRLSVWNHKRHAMTLLAEESHVRVRVLDAHAFFPGSLRSVAKMVGVDEKDEYDKEALATLTRADLSDPVFRHYAAQDAVVTRLVGERIVTMHEQYDLTTSMTAPQFASKVFRRSFLEAEIALPEPALEQAGLASYHGGKNGFYLRRPTRTQAWNMDIVSAYPEAMRALPALEGSRFEREDAYQAEAHALWLVRFYHRPCKFVGAQDHGGRHLPPGMAEVWLTGYELDAMLDHDEAAGLEVLDGWVMHGEGNGGGLVRFVDTFFAKKRVDTGVERATDKLLLNSLYGKFFQKMPLGSVGDLEGVVDEATGDTAFYVSEGNPGAAYDYRAGGLYHPPVASLITGFVRAKVHRLEHRYHAMATSTDGFFARSGPWASDLGSGLGQLTAAHGTLDIWRERLYAFDEIQDGPVEKVVTKAALHGFRGDVAALREIPLHAGTYQYTARHPVTLRESQNILRGKRYRPGAFAALTFELDLAGVG